MTWKVKVLEYERGWGSKVYSIEEFETEESALKFQKLFNEENNKATVPDWYMVAELPYESR
jgi:hypothetical protein